jgi:hypothetical protein
MRYLVRFIFPALAVLTCNKPGPGRSIPHPDVLPLATWNSARFVCCIDTNANQRARMIVSAINRAPWALTMRMIVLF